MNILVACEESQAVTKELRRLGHEEPSEEKTARRKWLDDLLGGCL